MAKISQLSTATSLSANDLFEVVNVNDSTMSVTGTNKKITAEALGDKLSLYINKDVKAVKFPNQANWQGSESYYVTSFFLSQDKRLYGSGWPNGYRFGLGSYQHYKINNGFRDVTPNLLPGEYIEEMYTCRYSIYVLTNLKNLYSAGYNAYGQLGRSGTTTDQFWGKINLSNVTWFSPRNSNYELVHCMAISNGQLYTWGYNARYQLGTGDTTNRSTPTLINGGSIAGRTITKAFACGDDGQGYAHSFVIDSDRNLHFVGDNFTGQGGTGDTLQKQNFVMIGGGIKADHVASKSWASAGTTFILDGKTLYTCGDNTNGQLGIGSTTDRTTFGLTTPALTDVDQLVACNYYNGSVIVKLSNGTVRTWGRNNRGQCGNGNTTQVSTPYNPGLTNVSKVFAVGGEEYCTFYALTQDGECYTSGYNGYGQKGIGTDVENNQFSLMLKNSNYIKFKDITGWSDGGSGSGVNLLDQNNNLYAVGYTQWGVGGYDEYLNETYCYVPIKAAIK